MLSISSDHPKQSDLVLALQELLPNADISINPYEFERHGRGESYHATKKPDVIVSPTSVDDVVTVLKYANENVIPIVPFGMSGI